ncbi:MAG: starch-binding protein, partial [Ruminococcus sp.]|nr:starch-binding protein [Ruminococcus sp.]
NNKGSQTLDLSSPNGNKIYKNGGWQNYVPPTEPITTTKATSGTNPTTATQGPTVPLSDYLVFYHNEKNFSNPYVYYWSDSNKQMVAWPGIAMTHYVGDVYYAQLPQDAKYVIFSDNGGNKTGDLTMQSFGMIYGNGKWSDYYNPATIPPTTVTSPITEPITQAETTAEQTTQREEVQTTVQTIERVLIGDANLSNSITIRDVTEIQQYLVELVTFSDKAKFASETDEDGKVNIKDATNIQKYLLDFDNCGNVGVWKNYGAEPETTPVTTKPTTAPVPTTTKPIPTTTAPVPTTTAPVPTTTAPTVPTTVKTTGMIYYKNVNNWSNVSAYYWSDTDENMSKWPGNTMKNEGNGIYSIEIPLSAKYIIFNNGGNGSQTGDLTISGFDMIYENGVWKSYQKEQTTTQPVTTQPITQPVTQPITTQPTTEPQPEVSHKIYYENTSNWGGVRAYYWSDTNKSMVSWPGVTMTKVKGSIYGVEIPDDAQYVIFNNGASNQTDDITIPARGMLYSGGKWVNYTEPYAAKTVIYLKDSGGSNGKLNWNTLYVYYWSIADSEMTDFPGLAMTKVSTDLWKAEIPVAAECLIFSNAGSDQSPPIIFYYENHTNMYDYGNAVWTNYNG